MIMGYENLNFENIQDVLLGANEKKYQQNPYSYGYIEKAIIYYNDDTASVVEFTDASDAKDFCRVMTKNGINLDNKVYKTNTKTWKSAYKEVKEEKKDDKVKNALVTAGLVAGIGVLAATSGAVGYKLGHGNDSNETSIELDMPDEEGYGAYKFDLSDFSGMDQYASEIPDSLQKENALNYLNILQKFNQEITLVDETKQLGGLTIQQLIAIDAYSNSNIYTTEDYVKTFGLYDFSNVSSDFQQGTIAVGSFLADSTVDGTVLADIFKDEAVKNFYLKALEYQHKILTTTDSKEKKQNIKDFEEFMNDVAVDQTSDSYLKYNEHPGMAFATTAIVTSLNYNNVKLSSNLISKIIVIGSEEHLSKVDSICSSANAKIDEVKDLVIRVNEALVNNKNNKIYNNLELQKAAEENRQPVLLSLQYEELDDLISETLCDQNQINDLIDKELEKTNQFVTIEDQQKINANAVEIARKLQNEGSNYANKQIAELAKQLQKPGDTASITQTGISVTTEEQKQDIIKNNPEAINKAKNELNQREGLIANETKDEQKAAEDKINQDRNNVANQGTNYVNQVVAYYEIHGNVSGIPSELQAAYNNLGDSIFNTAKNTGISRWEVKNQPTTGGEITPLPGFEDVDTDANQNTNNSGATEIIAPDKKTESTVTPDNSSTNDTIKDDNNNTTVKDNNDNTVIAPDGNNGSTIGGEITTIPGFEDIDISDISDNPTMSYSTDNITEAEIDAYINNLSDSEWNEIVSPNEDTISNEFSGFTR